MKNKIISALLCLAVICPNSALSAQKNGKKPTPPPPPAPKPPVIGVSAVYKPSIQFADTNKDGIIDPLEMKAFDEEKFKVFDHDRNSILDKKELERFSAVDKVIANAGKGLDALDAEDKALYKKWRQILLSLSLKSEELVKKRIEAAAGNQPAASAASAASSKCYPDKVCDDPTSPYYGRKDGVRGVSVEDAIKGPAIPVPPGENKQGKPVKETDKSAAGKEITVFYAAGLNAAMDDLIKEFKKARPSANIIGESSGSVLAIRKVTELGKSADVILVADELLIPNKLMPKYADWYLTFAKDRIVIAYTERSRYANEIDKQNWYKILLRNDVRYGYANPALAPIGYRALMTWQLADIYYKDNVNNKGICASLKEACRKENVLPDVAELLNVLESLSLDYAFVYESTAKQHNLKYIRLPEEIDLGNPDLADFYKQASVEIISKSGRKEVIAGSPVTFALTILKDARNFKGAVEFVKLLLGPEGQRILASNDQEVVSPCRASNPDKVPAGLKEFIAN